MNMPVRTVPRANGAAVLMPARGQATGAVLHRSNTLPQGASAKRMLFYRFLYDTGRISDDDN